MITSLSLDGDRAAPKFVAAPSALGPPGTLDELELPGGRAQVDRASVEASRRKSEPVSAAGADGYGQPELNASGRNCGRSKRSCGVCSGQAIGVKLALRSRRVPRQAEDIQPPVPPSGEADRAVYRRTIKVARQIKEAWTLSIRNLDALFAPSTIALIGASNRPGSVGSVLARNLFETGFIGPVLTVNPKEGQFDRPSTTGLLRSCR